MRFSSLLPLFALLPLLFSSCMVGPRYKFPVTLMPESFSEEQSGRIRVGEAVNEELSHWWSHFNDPFLDELLEESLAGSFDLAIAVEKVCQARASYWVQFTHLLPEIDSDIQAIRSRNSQTLTTSLFLGLPIQNFYQAGFDAIWEIDLFGGLRRAARSAYALWQASAEQARNARITLLSEVASTYVNICAAQKNLSIARERVRLDIEQLSLSKWRQDAGLTNQQEIELASAQRESDQAAVANIEITLKQAIYSLSILLGKAPESLLERFTCRRPIPLAIGRVPLGLPSELLRRRPDIRSAERELASNVEQIGVAIAQLFPKVALTGSSTSYSANPLQGANVGFASNSLSRWFSAPSLIWGIGSLVTAPIFDFGERIAQVNQQISLEHQSFFTYQKTVISALQEVEGDLVAYFKEEERLKNFKKQLDSEGNVLQLTVDLYEAGLSDYGQLLQVENNWLAALSIYTTSQQTLSRNLIALYKALGGGWECSYMP